MIVYTVHVCDDGSKFWFLDGKLHREDGPAVDGVVKQWWKHGKLHREDGPAVFAPNGARFWCRNGMYHREDGPAVEWADGNFIWYLNGVSMTEEEHREAINPTKELTVSEIEALLGYRVKIVK